MNKWLNLGIKVLVVSLGLVAISSILQRLASSAYNRGAISSANADVVVKLKIAQGRYIHDSTIEWVAVDYIDTALEASLYSQKDAAKIIDVKVLKNALNSHLEAYLKFYKPSIVTGNDNKLLIIGVRGGGTLRIFRGSVLELKINEGDNGADTIHNLLLKLCAILE